MTPELLKEAILAVLQHAKDNAHEVLYDRMLAELMPSMDIEDFADLTGNVENAIARLMQEVV